MTKGGKNGILQWQKEANSKTLTGQTDKYRLEQFRNQQIDKIKISKITTRNYEIASVKIYIGKNYHKVDFGGIQCNFTNSLQRAEQFSLKLVPENKIVIQACLEELTNLTNYKREDRLLVNSFSQTQHGDKVKYEKVSGKNINLIKISSTNVRGSRIVLVNCITEKKTIRLSFGGKFFSEKDSFFRALEFARNLLPTNQIQYSDSLRYHLQ